MATITALNVRLGMDASNFSAGADLARNEVNRVSTIMRQSVPPAEKFKREVELLNKAFSESGKKTADFASAMEHLRKKYGQVDPAAKKATMSVDQLRQSMLSSIPGGHMFANMLKGPAGAMIALGAAAAIAMRGMKQAADRIDETAKAARSLGFEYNDLIAIQVLAGEVAGVDASAVNRGMGQFVRKLAEARVNGGQLKEVLASLGMDVDKLASMAPADAFAALSDAVAGVADKSEQVRIATLLFGKEGVKMVELLRQGSDETEKMKQEMERLGQTMSDTAIAEIEAMNDAFGRSGMAVEGIWNTMLSGLAPTLTNIAKTTTDFLVATRKAFEFWAKFHPVVQGIGFLFNKMLDGFQMMMALASDVTDLISSLPGWLGGVDDLNTKFERSSKQLDDMEASANGTADAIKAATKAEEEAGIVRQRAQDAIDKFNQSYEDRLRNLQIESVALTGNIELAERMRLATEGYSQAQIDTIIAMQQQNDLIKERIATEAEAAKEAERAAKKKEKENEKAIADAVSDWEAFKKSFEIEVESSMKAAKDFFDNERQQDDARRKDASAGPSSMEVGSADAAKFMADAVNERLGAEAVPEKPTPGEAEIAKKTHELLLAQRVANTAQQEELRTMVRVIDAIENNATRRVR